VAREGKFRDRFAARPHSGLILTVHSGRQFLMRLQSDHPKKKLALRLYQRSKEQSIKRTNIFARS